MRKILAVLAVSLFVCTFASCGGDGPSKAKAGKSDTDSSDSDSDSKSSSKKSSSSRSSSSRSSSSKSSGGSADEFCTEVQHISTVFNDSESGVLSKGDFDTIVAALRDLQDAAPNEIADEVKTLVTIELRAVSAARSAGNDSDAQGSAADEVFSDAGSDFLDAVTKVDQFSTDTCGFNLGGESSSDSFSFSS
jgi:hypothetical protein